MAIDKSPEVSNDEPDLAEDEEISFLQYMEGQGYKDVDPLSKEGLSLQAKYVATLSQHPLDILRRIMTNLFCTPQERMAAAKAVMEYSMRKVPSSLDVTTDSGALKIDGAALVGLSMDELDFLEKIMAKVNDKDTPPPIDAPNTMKQHTKH